MIAPQADNLVELLRVRAHGGGDTRGYDFLGDGERLTATITFADLDRAASSLAAKLKDRICTGSNVLLAYPPGLEFIAAFFGCLYTGLVPVPVCLPHPRKSNDRLTAIAADCEARDVLSNAAGGRLLAAAGQQCPALEGLRVTVTGLAEAHDAFGGSIVVPSPASIAFLQYTSGSTCSPRGVCVTHANVMSNLAMIHAAEGNDASSRGVSWLPAYHDMGLIEGILQPLYVGYATTLMPHSAFLQRPLRWLQAISRLRATVSGGPNFAYDACVRRVGEAELETLDLSSWRVAYCGAEPVRAETLAAFAARFERCGFKRSSLRPVYGLAEATLLVSASSPDVDAPAMVQAQRAALEQGCFVRAAEHDERVAVVSCGRPSPGVEVRIVDAATQFALPEGRVGEVWVSGPSVSAGYYGAHARTSEVFREAELDGVRARWLCTGDLGFLARGQLHITGRSKEVIILRGRKLHPQDIEHTVQRMEGVPVAAAAAFGLEEAGGEGVVVLIEPRGARASPSPSLALWSPWADEIRTEVFRQHEIALAALAFVGPGALARTSSGKLMRFRCRDDFIRARLPILACFDAPSRTQALAEAS